MPRLKVVTSSSVSRKIVEDMLLKENIVAVSVKQKYLRKPEEIYLITVGLSDGRVFLFDIHKCQDIMYDGQLWRILTSNDLTKVMHDCRSASLQLKQQFRVSLNNVFDTQAAYCVLLAQAELPPRLIDLMTLYQKHGDMSLGLSDFLYESVETGGIYWGQRPMPPELPKYASSEVLALYPGIYQNLKREMSSPHQDCRQIYKDCVKERSESNWNRISTEKPLSPRQKNLISGTIPPAKGWKCTTT